MTYLKVELDDVPVVLRGHDPVPGAGDLPAPGAPRELPVAATRANASRHSAV